MCLPSFIGFPLILSTVLELGVYTMNSEQVREQIPSQPKVIFI